MLALSALTPAPAEAQSFRFNTVAVEGNRQIDAATIAGFARIAQSRAITSAELNAAYQRVIATGFFRTVEFLPQGGRLVIRVEEFPLINRVAIEGNRRVRDEQLQEVVSLRPGGVFSPNQAEADANAMAEVYAAGGRLAARVTPRVIEREGGRVDVVFEVEEGRVVEIQRVAFVGNRSFSERRLRNAIETAQAGRLSTLFRVDNFNERRIARDRQALQDFYLSRGFADAQVTAATTELTRERDGAFVTFTIREGQQYRFGAVSVISEIDGIDPAAYQAALSERRGDLFTPNALEALIQQAEAVGYRSGQRFVRAEPRLTRNERDGTIEVVMALVAGPRVFVERIDIQGNTTTEDQVIRRQFDIAEGDPLNPREIREAAARIEALGYFSDVRVNPVQGSAPDQAVVDVQVEETTTGSLGFGLSYGQADGIGGNISYQESNFLGRGQQLALTVTTVSSARALDLSFTEPSILGRDLAFSIRLGLNRRDATADTQFGSETMQFSPSLSFPLSEFGRLSVRAGIAQDQISVVAPPTAPDLDPIPARLRQDAGLGRVTTATAGFTYSFNTQNNGPDPDRGFRLEFSADIAGGDRQWARSSLLLGYEQRVLNGDVTLRAELEAGVVAHRSGPSRVTERFSLSSRQFRGFRPYGMGPTAFADSGARQGLGGNTYAVLRLDAEFQLGLPQEYNLTGGLFLDVGTLRGIDAPGPLCAGGMAPPAPGVGTGCVVDSGSLRAAVGVSVFWRSPFGPLRLNFAHPIRREAYDRPQRFDLSVATRF